MDLASQLLVCLAVTALCAGIARRIAWPLPLLQVIAGALMAWPSGMHLPLDPEAFFLLIIPPLLFIEGWRIPKHELARYRPTILMMSFGLVIITALGVGWLISWLIPAIPLPVAFAIGAALSPTDAVAVMGITGRTRIAPRLMTLLQGEALFNDASGLVSLRLAVAAMLTGGFSVVSAVGSFVLVVLGGIVVGVVLTWVFGRLLNVVLERGDNPDAKPRVLLIIVFPYAVYLVAEHFGFSGILAAAAGGLMAGRFGLVAGRHRSARLQGASVLEMLELVLNGLAFVLLGLQLPNILAGASAIARQADVSVTWLAIDVALVVVALLVIRFLWVWVSFSLTVFRARSRGHIRSAPPFRLLVATAVAGVRGTMTLAAALTLPLTLVDGSRFPARDVAIFFATTVIVIWLVGASLGLPRLLKGLEVPSLGEVANEAHVRARLAEAAVQAILKHLATQPGGAMASAETADVVLDHYRARVVDAAEPLNDALAHERALRLVGIAAEREHLVALHDHQAIGDEIYRAVLRELDMAEEGLVVDGLVVSSRARRPTPRSSR